MKQSEFLISFTVLLLYLFSCNRIWCSPLPDEKVAANGTNTSDIVAAPVIDNTSISSNATDNVASNGGGTSEDGPNTSDIVAAPVIDNTSISSNATDNVASNGGGTSEDGPNTSDIVAAPVIGNTSISSNVTDNVASNSNGGGTNEDGPIRLNLTVAEVFNTPPRRPYTLYEPGKAREFITVRIIPGDTLCSFNKFFYFFGQASQMNVKPADLLRRAIFSLNGTDYYFYDPEDLCILIEDELNIDIYNYDCGKTGICTCGLYYGYVDPNVPQPEPINQIRTYLAVNGLDRKLVEEQEVCVSGLAGHCTLDNSTALEKLYCKSTMDCVLDDSYGPILTNKITHETYGICLLKKPVA